MSCMTAGCYELARSLNWAHLVNFGMQMRTCSRICDCGVDKRQGIEVDAGYTSARSAAA